MSEKPPPYPPLSPPPGSVEEALTQALALARAKSEEAAQKIAALSRVAEAQRVEIKAIRETIDPKARDLSETRVMVKRVVEQRDEAMACLAAAEAEVSRVANRAAAEASARQERLGVALGLEHPRSCDFDELIRRVEADAKTTSAFRRAVGIGTMPLGGLTMNDVLRAAHAAVEASKVAGCSIANLPREVQRFALAHERGTSEHRAVSIVLKKRAAEEPAAWAFGDELPPSEPAGPVLKYMKTGRWLIGEFKRGSAGAAGIDLPIVNSRINIDPGGTLRLYTGIKIEIPPGYEGQIRPRSSAAALGLVIDGTIDADYRGEVMVVVTNASRYPAVIDRPIAQLVIAPVAMLQPVEVDSLSETKRGAGGFGSTDGGVS